MRADGEFLEAQHVHYANLGNSSSAKVRMLVHHRANQQAAVGSAGDGQLLRRRIFVGDQPFRRGGEIVEDILLFQLGASVVPLFAVLPAAAKICGSVDKALLEQRQAERIEPRRNGDVESTVSEEQRGIRAIELYPFFVNQKHRN